MTGSRILDTFVTLLFLIRKVSRVKTACRIRDFFIVTYKFFVFRKHRFSALHGGALCGYLLQSCLLLQFIAGYRSSLPINFGGELNDFHK
jgi:hypothetical protein